MADWSVTGNAGTDPSRNFLGTTDAAPLVVRTSGTEALRVLPDHRVGVGTAEPRTPLHVLGRISSGADFTSAGALTLFPPDGFAWFHLDNGPAGGRPLGRLRISHGVTPGTFEIMCLVQNGRVGIGTPTPDARLTVAGTDLNAGHTLHATSNSGDGAAVLGENHRPNGTGVLGRSGIPGLPGGTGLRGESTTGHGVQGVSGSHIGVEGTSTGGTAIFGESRDGIGMWGTSTSGTGVFAQSTSGQFLIEGWDRFVNRRFAVERATGRVLADGGFTGPADFAEMLPVAGAATDYEPGDVLAIGDDGRLIKADAPNSTRLAGVYSTRPGFVGDVRVAHRGLKAYDVVAPSETAHDADEATAAGLWLPVALVGVVPVKVTAGEAPIRPGDLLTTSPRPGHAMRATPVEVQGMALYTTGTILGKALDRCDGETGVIQVLLMQR